MAPGTNIGAATPVQIGDGGGVPGMPALNERPAKEKEKGKGGEAARARASAAAHYRNQSGQRCRGPDP